jgi:beta-galactosidase
VQGGVFLLDQVAWESEEPHLRQAMRYVCTLLTNLGVALHTSAFQTVDPKNFFTVDLRGFCNMGFRDEVIGDQQGGWTDQGPQDLRNVPVGQAVHGSAFYDVIDPATNGGKSCIVLRGSHRPYFPPEVRGIPVGQRARALWFLHSCAWALSDTRPVLKYVVHYADGTTAEAPVRCGLHVADWFGPPQDLGASEAAWVGQTYSLDFKDQRPCCLYAMRWTNPYPDRVIQSLDLVGQDTDAVPVVVAVSGEK